MFIAMNRFKIKPEHAAAFEDMWAGRESYLHEVPGFVEFHLLKGPAVEAEDGPDYVLYSSHVIWTDHSSFDGWTKSEAFRKAHAQAGASSRDYYVGPPNFEGFEVVQTVDKDGKRS